MFLNLDIIGFSLWKIIKIWKEKLLGPLARSGQSLIGLRNGWRKTLEDLRESWSYEDWLQGQWGSGEVKGRLQPLPWGKYILTGKSQREHSVTDNSKESHALCWGCGEDPEKETITPVSSF